MSFFTRETGADKKREGRRWKLNLRALEKFGTVSTLSFALVESAHVLNNCVCLVTQTTLSDLIYLHLTLCFNPQIEFRLFRGTKSANEVRHSGGSYDVQIRERERERGAK